MSNVSNKDDWENSRAHLLLLSKFLHGDSASRYDNLDFWEAALKEQPAKAIKRFLDRGMLEPAELPNLVDHKFRSNELKTMLKERGLKVSGQKSDLIQRLIENDPGAMRDATRDLVLWRCTPSAATVAQRYLEEEEKKKIETESETLRLLSTGDLLGAVSCVVRHERDCVFPRGIGVDWKNRDTAADVEVLKTIFQRIPDILKDIERTRLDAIRVSAAMMHLWGTSRVRQWLPDGFETGFRLNADIASRMLVAHAFCLRQIKEYRESRVVKVVEILGAGDSCPECQQICGRKYALNKVPELPYSKCTSELGCRCDVIPCDIR